MLIQHIHLNDAIYNVDIVNNKLVKEIHLDNTFDKYLKYLS